MYTVYFECQANKEFFLVFCFLHFPEPPVRCFFFHFLLPAPSSSSLSSSTASSSQFFSFSSSIFFQDTSIFPPHPSLLTFPHRKFSTLFVQVPCVCVVMCVCTAARNLLGTYFTKFHYYRFLFFHSRLYVFLCHSELSLPRPLQAGADIIFFGTELREGYIKYCEVQGKDVG